ncbi:hypothetical protein PQX77_005501 [Marasmius sp. AFHP31]|nr:hypothetical protein PQX77_005501 [Marasmius sp. AFHP31]
MFASLRLGAVARLARTPVSMSLLGVRPLSTPAILRRTFLTSSRVNEPTTSKASETKGKATKTTTKKTSTKKPAAKKKAAPKKAKKVVAKKKPVRPKKVQPPKIDKALLKPPKRPNTPYLVWHVEQTQMLGKPKTLVESQERSRTIGSDWRNLSETDKDKYRQKYADDLREWTQRYAEWYNRLTPEQLKAVKMMHKKKKSLRLHKPAGQPTRPPSSFLAFYLEYRKQHPGLSTVEASKESAKAWKELPQATKEGYQQRFYAAKEQYVKDLENYKQSFA